MTQSPVVTILDLCPPADDFLDDVIKGFSAHPRAISPKYFYDARGSELFERICGLPEYYPTRTEVALMHEHADAMAQAAGAGSLLIEYGCGACVKTEILIEAVQPAAYVPVEISSAALRSSVERLAVLFPGMPMVAVCADYMRPLDIPELARYDGARRLVYFPGSTIGNLTPEEAAVFLRHARALAGAGGAMLVGVDMKKDPAVLHAAYNDAQGITAAFNLNLLHRINRELGGNFDVEQFRHVAFYNDARGRIEMHLESCVEQTVTLGGRDFRFAAGERIHTENSCKYSVDEFRALAQLAGFVPRQVWVDARGLFSVHLLSA